ncbi:hypothetical protein IWQ62_000138 [Dispira parvispora]|uniref:MAPEG family protein n=1 Tax=Dispira parvispora TaxID=1520584 RepID=A0A9W8EA00_9FUNG|nr:hypothetical protein IWQ62_000138 [Dispira parvispora]
MTTKKPVVKDTSPVDWKVQAVLTPALAAASLFLIMAVQRIHLLAPAEWFVHQVVLKENADLALLGFTAVWTYYITNWVANLSMGFFASNGKIAMSNMRAQKAFLSGLPARLNAVHFNALETFPLFAAAVVSARIMGVPPHLRAGFAMIYVVARLVHAVSFALDLVLLRTLSYYVSVNTSLILLAFAANPQWYEKYEYYSGYTDAKLSSASKSAAKVASKLKKEL